MRSTQHIYEPDRWKIVFEGKSKIFFDDYIYEVVIGHSDDELLYGDICIFISKDNYENILNGSYSFKVFLDNDQKIILFDKENNIIPLIKGKEEIYNEEQQQYIKQLKIY